MSSYILTDDQGAPTGSIDMNAITDAGTKLAFAVADMCNSKTAAVEAAAQVLALHGPTAFGYICANALQVLATEILDPVLEVTQALGQDLRPGISAIADGRNPADA